MGKELMLMKKKRHEWGKVYTYPPFENREKLVSLSCEKCKKSFWIYSPGDNYFPRVFGSERALKRKYRCKKCGQVTVVAWEPISL